MVHWTPPPGAGELRYRYRKLSCSLRWSTRSGARHTRQKVATAGWLPEGACGREGGGGGGCGRAGGALGGPHEQDRRQLTGG